MQSPIPGGHVAWWTTTLALVVYAHNHYRDGQSGAGVTLGEQHSRASGSEGGLLGPFPGVRDRHCAMQTSCGRQPTAVQPVMMAPGGGISILFKMR